MLIYLLKTDFSGKDRRLFRDMLLKHVLYETYGVDLLKVKFYKNEYGKPYMKNREDIYFSVSYSTNFAACSIGSSVHGIDVEEIRDFDYYVAERSFSTNELQNLNNSADRNKFFFTIWTLKECLGKAKGTGLNYDLRKTSFVISDGIISCSDNSFNYKTYKVMDGYMLSAATNEKIEDIKIKEVVIEDGKLNNVRQSVQKI